MLQLLGYEEVSWDAELQLEAEAEEAAAAATGGSSVAAAPAAALPKPPSPASVPTTAAAPAVPPERSEPPAPPAPPATARQPALDGSSWAELTAAEQRAAQAIGYSEESWDEGEVPETCTKIWKLLTPLEQSSALVRQPMPAPPALCAPSGTPAR